MTIGFKMCPINFWKLSGLEKTPTSARRSIYIGLDCRYDTCSLSHSAYAG